MKRVLKLVTLVVAVILILVIATLFVIPHFLDAHHYRPLIEREVSKATGRDFSISDDLRFSLFPRAGLAFSDLAMGNPPGFAESDFITVKSFSVRVRLFPLLFKDVRVERFIVNEPRITLIRDREGRGNWTFDPGKATEPATEKPAQTADEFSLPIKALAVGECAVTNGMVILKDRKANRTTEITDIDLVLEHISLDKPIGISLSCRVEGKPLSLDGTVGPLGTSVGRGIIPVDLTCALINELEAHLRGAVENPAGNARIDVTMNTEDFSPRALVEAFDQPFPVNTADPDTFRTVALTAKVRGDAAQVAVTDGEMVLDETTVQFSMKIQDFSRPALNFDIHIDTIDLDRYLPPEAEAKSGEAKKQTVPPVKKSSPVDYEPLRRLIMEGKIRMDACRVAGGRMEALVVKARAKDGILDIDPLQMNLYGGTAGGSATMDVREKTPAVAVRLSVNDLHVCPLLQDMFNKDILEGAAAVDLELSARGDRTEEIKGSLNGRGKLTCSDGAVKGVDLAAMARNVKSAFGLETQAGPRPRTDFAELVVPFTITDGLIAVPAASMKAPFLRLEASGKADLVDETLDFRVTPKAVATIKGQGDETKRSGIRVPLIVTGTFDKPVFRPDLKSILTQEINTRLLEKEPLKKILDKEEVKRLEEPARRILNELIKDR